MYELRCYRNKLNSDYIVVSCSTSLKEIIEKRLVSGELVFFDGQLVDPNIWLWNWEKEDKNSYAASVTSYSN